MVGQILTIWTSYLKYVFLQSEQKLKKKILFVWFMMKWHWISFLSCCFWYAASNDIHVQNNVFDILTPFVSETSIFFWPKCNNTIFFECFLIQNFMLYVCNSTEKSTSKINSGETNPTIWTSYLKIHIKKISAICDKIHYVFDVVPYSKSSKLLNLRHFHYFFLSLRIFLSHSNKNVSTPSLSLK